MINTFAFLSLFASIVCFTFGFSVHFLSKKNMVNIIFMLLCLSISYWAFTDFMFLQSETYESAAFWVKAGFLWPFTSAFMYHFSVVFSGRKPIFGNNFTLLIVYSVATIFSNIELGTYLITGTPVMRNGFYSYAFDSESVFFWFSTIFIFVMAVLGLAILTKYYLMQTKGKRKQAKLVVIGFTFPIFISLLSEMVPYFTTLYVPDLSAFSTMLLCIFVGVAIQKYGLFSLDLFTASEIVFSTMPDSIVLIDSEGKILSINHRLIDILGYSEQDLFFKPVSFLFEIESAACIQEAINSKKELQNYETFCITKSKNLVPVSVSVSMVYDNEHDIVGAVFVVRDITEKKEMESRLLKSEKMAALGQAATMVGHDLRNPLQSIQNAVYCIKRDLTKNSMEYSRIGSSLRMIEIIEAAITYSDNIVMDLKYFSTERKPQFVSIDVNQLVKDALNSAKLPETLEVLTELNSVPFVLVDKPMIKRTFVNILTNGSHAMSGGGTFKISTAVSDGFVAIRFQDSGMGMSDETRKKLFTPFFTTKAQGMGMGLAICKKFVESNKGQIKVESKQGQGSTFTILLPISLQQITWANQN